MELGSEEADQIDGDRAVASVAMRPKASFLTHDLLPGLDQAADVPGSVRERLDASADGFLAEAAVGERRDERASAGEEAPGHQSEEDLQEGEVGSDADGLQKREQARTQCVK